jgi:hypothetical protein
VVVVVDGAVVESPLQPAAVRVSRQASTNGANIGVSVTATYSVQVQHY